MGFNNKRHQSFGVPPDKFAAQQYQQDSPSFHYHQKDDSRSRYEEDQLFLQEILGPPIPPVPDEKDSSPWLGSDDRESTSSFLSPTLPYNTRSSSQRSSPSYGSSGGIKKRRRLLPEETEILVKAFERSQKPTIEMRDELSTRLNMSPRAIQIWFQNRRAKVRRDRSESQKSTLSFAPVQGLKLPMESSPAKIAPHPLRQPGDEEMEKYKELFVMPDVQSSTGSMIESPLLFTTESSQQKGTELLESPTTWIDPLNWPPLMDLNSTTFSEASNSWMDDFLNA